MEIEHIIKKQLEEITHIASEIVRIWEMEKEAANLFGFMDGWIFPAESGVVKGRLELGGRRWAYVLPKETAGCCSFRGKETWR